MSIALWVDGETDVTAATVNPIIAAANAATNVGVGTYNVLDFPGVDPTGVGDSRAGIQLAADALYAAGGGTLYFPTGRYRLAFRDGFYYSSFKTCLWTFGSNVAVVGAEGAVIAVDAGHSNGFAIFSHTSLATPDTLDSIVWDDTFYTEPEEAVGAFICYPMTAVDRGEMLVTLATPANAANFSAGDAIFIRTGQTIAVTNGQPDAEINEVVTSNASTGVLTLKYPPAKDYVQEYFVSGTTGVTTTNVTANPALFGVQNIESAISRNISYRGLTFDVDQDDGRGYCITTGSMLNVEISKCRATLREAAFQLGGPYRGMGIRDNIVTQEHASGSESFITADRGCGDLVVEGNTFVGVGAAIELLHIHEGTFNARIQSNQIVNQPLNTSSSVVSVQGRGYDIAIIGNVIPFTNSGAGEAVYVGDDVRRGEIRLNAFAGTKGVSVSGYQFRIEENDQTGLDAAQFRPIESVVRSMCGHVTHDDQTVELGWVPGAFMVPRVHIYVYEAFNSDGTDLMYVGWGNFPDDTSSYGLVNAVSVNSTGVKTMIYDANIEATINDGKTIKAVYNNSGTEPTTGRAQVVVEWMPVTKFG